MNRFHPLIFIFIFLLASCSGAMKIKVPNDVSITPSQAHGVIIGSIAQIVSPEKKLSGSAKVILLTEDNRTIQISFTAQKNGDFESDGKLGQVFHIPLKAGTYRLHRLSFQWVQGSSLLSNSTDDLDIEFEVENNNASYIGEFLVGSAWMDNVWKTMKVPTGMNYLIHSNQLDRDKDALIGKGELHPGWGVKTSIEDLGRVSVLLR